MGMTLNLDERFASNEDVAGSNPAFPECVVGLTVGYDLAKVEARVRLPPRANIT